MYFEKLMVTEVVRFTPISELYPVILLITATTNPVHMLKPVLFLKIALAV
jgi:hypothetical protein